MLSLVPTSDAKVSRRELVEAEVLALITERGPISKRDVRAGVKGRNHDVDTAISALLDAGLIVRSQEGLRACPIERGTPGHAPIATPPDESVPRGVEEDVVLPRWGTLSEAVPGARAPEPWAPQDEGQS